MKHVFNWIVIFIRNDLCIIGFRYDISIVFK